MAQIATVQDFSCSAQSMTGLVPVKPEILGQPTFAKGWYRVDPFAA
jgi:hypothetical protein